MRVMPRIPVINVDKLEVPAGWRLELETTGTHAIVTTPAPGSVFATIDFVRRGFRGGISTTGPMIGDHLDSGRPWVSGRGWQQALVDKAVNYLQGVIK